MTIATPKKPIIGLDVDGVLAAFDEKFLQLSRKYLAKPPKDWQQTHWHFEDCGVFTAKDVDYIWTEFRNTRNMWMQLKKRSKTNELMRKANQLELFFITSRVSTDGLSTEAQTQEWLCNNYAIKNANVFITPDAREKGRVAESLGLEWFIDDKESCCEEVKAAVPKCKVFILDTTYSKKFDNEKLGIRRAESVNEFIRLAAEGWRGHDRSAHR